MKINAPLFFALYLFVALFSGCVPESKLIVSDQNGGKNNKLTLYLPGDTVPGYEPSVFKEFKSIAGFNYDTLTGLAVDNSGKIFKFYTRIDANGVDRFIKFLPKLLTTNIKIWDYG